MSDIDRFLARVYDLFLTTPITANASFDEDDGPDGEPPPVDPALDVAIKADRFQLMSAVRALRNEAQKELPL